MQKLINLLKTKLKDNFFFKMYALMLLPVLIIVFFLFFSTFSYSKNYKELLKNGYLEKLELICTQNETSLQNISTIVRVLSENKDFMEIATANSPVSSNSADMISDFLKQVKENNALIDNICIYNRSNSAVYYDGGACHASTYFSSVYCYAEYPKSYFDNYISPDEDLKILPPTLVNNTNSQKTVIPLVFTKLGNVSTENLIIVNVNLTDILANANKSKLTENSVFFILSKQNRNIFSLKNDYAPSFSDGFYDNIYSRQITSFDCIVSGSESLAMSYSPGSSILGYAYIAIVPYTDINSRVAKLTYLMLLLGIFVLIAVFFGVYFSTKKIYTPIEDLALMFEDNPDNSIKNTNMLKRLHSSIQETLETNNSLYDKYTNALPLVQERYLINLLNSNEHYTPDKEHIDIPIDFKYDYFCSIVIKLKPTDEFYNLYNKLEYNAIKNGIHNIIESEFTEKYEVYIIPSETDTLYVLLNLPDDNESDDILSILSSFRSVMDYDKNYMTVKIGIGGIYPHLSGLKKSHHEAVNSVSSIIGLTHIRINNDENKLDTYDFGINDENILLNHLILGHSEEAKAAIEEILSKNIQRNVSDTVIMQLYIQILNVVFKVMRMKKIDYDPENSGDFHIIAEIMKQSVPEVHDTVFRYISVITEHTDTTSGKKLDIRSVIDYIDKNYSSDIGLEAIADNFSTAPKYLSKLIKDKLGVNFTDYLAGLRITAAKKLLSETDLTVSEIYEQVGFTNRNTFIRTFKKNTGLTPSDYRKLNKKK